MFTQCAVVSLDIWTRGKSGFCYPLDPARLTSSFSIGGGVRREKHYINTVFCFLGFFGQLYFLHLYHGMWCGSRKQIKDLRFQDSISWTFSNLSTINIWYGYCRLG